jgi:phosphoglycerate dehydrogenase-like enzyme
MKLAILDDYQRVALELADWSPVISRCSIDVLDHPLAVPDEAAAALQPYEILCTLRERMPIPRSLIERLPQLKYIQVTGKRYDTIDVAAAAERGILVSNTEIRAGGGGGVAELAWGLILATARHIAFEDRMMRQGRWQNSVGTTLKGKTLGIVGFGGIGRAVARIGLAFGMQVSAWSRSLTAEAAAAAGVTCVSLEELLSSSDVVSLHVVLGDSTRGLIGKREIALMKSTVVLVNTSRGPIVDESALLTALREKRIAGAGLDVFDVEPLPAHHPLRALDNAVLTPHLGYYTRELLSMYYQDAVEGIAAYLDGHPIRLVHPQSPRTE